MRRIKKVAALASLLIAISASFVAAQVEVHGFTQARAIAGNNNYTFRIDRFGLRLQQKIDDEFDWLTEIYVHPFPTPTSAVYMESAYLNWHLRDRLPWDFTVRFGKGRNETFAQAPYYSRRRTSDYTLFSEAYTQSRVLGIQTFSNFGPVQLAIGILNGYTPVLGGRQVPDFAVGDFIRVPLGDGETAYNTDQNLAVSGRLGYKNTVPVLGALNVGLSAYVSQTDAFPAVSDDEMNRYAVDGEFKTPQGFLAQGQFLTGSTAGIDQGGGEILGGWESAQYGLYARYGTVTYDTNTLPDLNQIMLSAIYKIRPAIHFRLEGLINGEDMKNLPGGEVDNDVIFFETLFAW